MDILRLNVYEFEIRYKPGASNGNADALSRMPEPLCTIEIDVPIDDFEDHVICTIEGAANKEFIISFDRDFNQISLDQDSDPNLVWIKKQLTFKKSIKEDPKSPMQKALQSNLYNFVIQDDKLFYKKSTKENTNLLYVIPDNAVEEILRVGHCSLLSGHLGIKKTMKKILSRFYRPGLKAAVKNFIKTCDMCQRVKITQPKRVGELKRLVAKKFNHIITIDMAGPFSKSKRGNIYILVMVCAFTKLSRAIPLPLSTADMISDAIISSWICLYSIPEYILSDRGKNFQSMLLELIYEKLDIKQLRTTAYHPECDGQSERFIRTLKAMIRGYVADNQQNWDENIEKLTFAYNTAEHSTVIALTKWFLVNHLVSHLT